MHRRWLSALVACLTSAGLAWAGEPMPDHAPLLCDEACACPETCGKNCWVSAEMLLWWIKSHPVPAPLLSTGPLNDPNTAILLGGGDLDADPRLGARFTFGGWINDEQTWGGEVSYFFLGPQEDEQLVSSTVAPTIVVPRQLDSGPNTFPLATPGQFTDLTTLNIRTWLQGAEANALANVASGNRGRIDLLGGFRYLQLDEELQLHSISPVLGPDFLALDVLDQFRCINNYYGGQLGVRAQATRGRFFADMTAKVGLAHVQQTQTISALALSSVGNAPPVVAQPGGFYVGSGNYGTHSSNDLAWLGELTLNAGVNITANVRAFVGYSFLYIDEAQRPGEQISPRATTGGASLFGQPLPLPQDNDSPFWAQGLNFGLLFQF